MSVEVRDFRKHLADKQEAEAQAEPARPLLQQAEVKDGLTGHPELDKLLRVLQDNIEMGEKALNDLAHSVCVTVSLDMKQKLTLEYMLARGMVEAYKAIQLLPAQIIREQRPQGHA